MLFELCIAGGISLFIWFMVSAYGNLKGTNQWLDIKANVPMLWVLPSAAILCLFVGGLMACSTPTYMAYDALFLACLGLGCSIVALQMAVITCP